MRSIWASRQASAAPREAKAPACDYAMTGALQLVAREGFEPPNAMQADLQSAPFGRLGISPKAARCKAHPESLHQIRSTCDAASVTGMSDEQLLHLATQLAREAGEMILERRQRGVAIADTKTSTVDVVTAADRECEQLLRERIRELRPDDGFYGEESDPTRSRSGVTWVVDPIDGTVNYLYGLPHYAVSIAAVEGDPAADPASFTALAGAVFAPALGEMYAAVRDGGATRNGKPLEIGAGPEDIARTLVATGFSYRAQRRKLQAQVWLALADQVRDMRRNGAASLDLCAVAAGQLDVYYEFGLKPWDWAAGALIAREAGAEVVGVSRDVRESRGMLVAGHPRIMPQLHDLLLDSLPAHLL